MARPMTEQETIRLEISRFIATSRRYSQALPARFGKAVAFACRRLVIPSAERPTVKVVDPCEIRDGGTGMYRAAGNEILLRRGLKDEEMLLTIFHEFTHLYERVKGWRFDEGFAGAMERELLEAWYREEA